MMLYRKKLISVLILLILVSLFLISCNSNDLSKKEYLAVINDEKIKVEEYKIYLWRIKQLYQNIGQEDIWETKFDGKPAEEVAKERAFDSIKSIKIQVQEGRKMELSFTEEEKEEVVSQTEELINSIGEEEMKNMGLTEQDIKNVVEDTIMSQKVYMETTKDFVGNKSEFEDFFEQNKEMLTQVRVKHILLKTHDLVDGKLVELSKEEQENAKIKAEEALEKARNGEDFDSLVQEYSQDESSLAYNGEYTFMRGQGMDKNFEDASFDLKVNEISDLVKSSYGYHIIKMEEIIEPDKELIELEYYDLMKRNYYNKKLEEWINNATVEINQEVWEEIKIL